MSDLIVIGYPDETTAQKVWEELVKLEHDYLVDLEDAAVIRRDVKGKLHVTTPAHHAVAWGTLSGLFWGVLIGLLLCSPITTLVGVAGGLIGAAVGEAKNLDIKDDFKQRVQDVVQPGTSAILVIVRKATPDKVEEALRPYGGTVLRCSLTRASEQQLLEALPGRGMPRRRRPGSSRPPAALQRANTWRPADGPVQQGRPTYRGRGKVRPR